MTERIESSCRELRSGAESSSSSSVSGFGRFLDTAGFFGFNVVCDNLMAATFGATADFLGAGFGFGLAFWHKVSHSYSRH